MIIKSEKDIQKLDDLLTHQFNINVSKYKNIDVAEKLADLIVFPKLVLSSLLKPIIISLTLFFIIFYISEFGFISSAVYFTLGLFLFLINGVLSGIIIVLLKMKSDINDVIEYSLMVLKECISDLNHVNSITVQKNKKDVLRLIFLGIIHKVIIPMLTDVIIKKTPYMGKFISNLCKTILRVTANKIKFNYEINKSINTVKDNPGDVINLYTRSIDQTIIRLDRLLTMVFRIVKTPFIATLIITSLFLVICLYLLI